MADVHFGFVYDFGSGEEWHATRGEGARLNGDALSAVPRERLELLSMEATRTDLVARHAPAFVPVARRIRVMGSLALSLCHLAAGRIDAVCSLKEARSVDVAAGQLIVREAGGFVSFPRCEDPLGAPLDAAPSSPVIAARTVQTLRELEGIPQEGVSR